MDERDHPAGGASQPGARPSGDYRALLASAEQLLDGVERALEALDAGAYGACRVCGGAIGGAELAADPLAALCAAHPVAGGAVVPEG